MSAVGDFAYNVATAVVGVVIFAVVLRLLGWDLTVTHRKHKR